MKTPGGLLLVQVEVAPDMEADLHHWYEDEHVAERLSVPGFMRVRRYRSVGENRKFLALYDLDSPAVLDSPEYLHFKSAGATPLTKRMEANFKSFMRIPYELISERKRS